MVRRPGTPPARHYDLAARSSLHGSGGNAGDGSAAPGRKPPRWSAERRASRVMGRAAPHQRGSRASHARQQHKCACRRSARPSLGRVRRDERPTRAHECVAGTKNTALFDIVELRKVREAGIALVSRLSFRSRKRSLHSAGTRDRGTRLICLERGCGKSASFVAMALL